MKIENERISMSFGVARIKPHIGIDAECLFRAADMALYAAKEAGRDRIIVGKCKGG